MKRYLTGVRENLSTGGTLRVKSRLKLRLFITILKYKIVIPNNKKKTLSRLTKKKQIWRLPAFLKLAIYTLNS